MSVQDLKGKKILCTAALLSLVTGRLTRFYFILKTIISKTTHLPCYIVTLTMKLI